MGSRNFGDTFNIRVEYNILTSYNVYRMNILNLFNFI
jgi:hypothetical protein